MHFWDLQMADVTATCLRTSEAEFSYEQVASLSDQIFAEAPRSVLLMLCDRDVETILGYLGALRTGIVPVLLPNSVSSSSLKKLVEIYCPRYIWLSGDRAKELSSIVGGCRQSASLLDYVLLELAPRCELPSLHADLALLMPTSGSTGDPKLVRLSYGNLQANAQSISNYLGLGKSDVAITSLPLNYSYGLSVLNSHLISGAQVAVTQSSVLEKDFWNLVQDASVTNVAGVPYTFSMLKRFRFEQLDLKSLRFMTQAGGPMGAALTEKFLDVCEVNNWQFYTMYGQTEATARISFVPPEQARNKLGSVGVPIPGGEVSLSGVAGHELSPGIGELVYSGPNVSLGYAYCAADLAKGDENNGHLKTGDLARIDCDGFIYIEGRLRRYAKIYGNNVNLDHIEAILKVSGVDSMVVADADRILVHVCSEGKSIASALQEQLSLPPTSIKVINISDFPINANGKRDYQALNVTLREG
jgi:long-chain acyl-CoA synthetase